MPVLQTPAIRTLERAPMRALSFLSGSQSNLKIKAVLKRAGFGDEARRLGWERLYAVINHEESGQTPVVHDPQVIEAIRALDRFDNHYLAIVDVTLRYHHPDAHDIVFAGGLQAAEGAQSVVVVKKLLDRVDTLSAAAQRLLAERGLNEGVRRQARTWLETVEGIVVGDVEVDLGGEGEEADEVEPLEPVNRAWHEAAVVLWRWLDEWSTIARKHITRRDHLIQLGLAQRKLRSEQT